MKNTFFLFLLLVSAGMVQAAPGEAEVALMDEQPRS